MLQVRCSSNIESKNKEKTKTDRINQTTELEIEELKSLIDQQPNSPSNHLKCNENSKIFAIIALQKLVSMIWSSFIMIENGDKTLRQSSKTMAVEQT